ncbi:MAG: NADP-dependent oxidoreductase [Steroidobacteraceae bacterium]
MSAARDPATQAVRNRQWRVARLLQAGELVAPEHFVLAGEAVPEPGEGELLVRTLCLSAGPAQRGYIMAQDLKSGFLPALPVGSVMRGRGVGVIERSRHPQFAAGEIFVGSLGWQEWSIQRPRSADFVFSAKRVEDPVWPLSTELGIVGNAGVTAYFGLLDTGAMRAGERVLVSAAAGGVGSMVGQIAKLRGATQVVGIAGSDDKCRWLVEELGYDAAVNYKAQDVDVRLGELCPQGFDVFFDNVGGTILEQGLLHLAMHARVVICGWISSDYKGPPPPGPSSYRQLLYRRARMEGFVVFDYWRRYPEAERQLKQWYRAGRLCNSEQVLEGLECMPLALQSLFTGASRGIVNCRVAPDPPPPASPPLRLSPA